MKKFLVCFFVVLYAVPLSVAVWAQQNPKKYALVIGNQNYTDGKLSKTINDANDMETALKSMGFSVEKVIDGKLRQMQEALTRFKDRLKENKTAYGFFYYSGHGAQDRNNMNYLIPVDAYIPSESYLGTAALSFDIVMNEISSAENHLNVIVLDACRDLPKAASKSMAKGLGQVTIRPKGSITVFATLPGEIAVEDSTGKNSLYTEHLLKHIITPDLDVNEMFRRVNSDVLKASGGKQSPDVSSRFFDIAFLHSTNKLTVGSINVTSDIAGIIRIDGKDTTTRIKAGGTEVISNVKVGSTEVAVKGDDGKITAAPSAIMVLGGQTATVAIKTAVQKTTTLTVNKSSLSFPVSGGSEGVTVTTNGSNWKVASSPSWCTVVSSGNSLSISSGSNSGTARSGTIKITSDDKEARIEINQSGIQKATKLTVNGWEGVKQTFDYSGGTVTYPVATDGKKWEIKNLPSWITVSSQSASSFTIRCASNSSSSPRKDWFKVIADDKEVVINVEQSGAPLVQKSYICPPCATGDCSSCDGHFCTGYSPYYGIITMPCIPPGLPQGTVCGHCGIYQ